MNRESFSIWFLAMRLRALRILRQALAALRQVFPRNACLAERLLILVADTWFRQPLDPNSFSDLETFDSRQSPDDFFTLCRKVGVARSWFAGKRLLDIGCGTGWLAADISGLGALAVTAIDVSAPCIEFAGCRHRLPTVTFQRKSVYQLDLPTAQFDGAYSHTVFEHLADIPAALRELHRVLKPGGEAILTYDSFRSRYGAHLGVFVRIPWPLAFFSEEAVLWLWQRKRARFLLRRGLTASPLLDITRHLGELNRLPIEEVERLILNSPFKAVGVATYNDDPALARYFSDLGIHDLDGYFSGSRVYRLRRGESEIDAIAP